MVWVVGAVVLLGPQLAAATLAVGAQPTIPAGPVFKSSIDLVSVSAVVRDKRGRIVRDLDRDDFEVFDNGVRRRIVEFAPAEDGPVSLAVLFDTSGSMSVTSNLSLGRLVAEQLLALPREDPSPRTGA